MNRRTFLKTLPALGVLASPAVAYSAATGTASGFAQELQPITLLKPQTEGGKSVLAALWERKTIRNISPEKLPPQVLSNLLWAAFGVNREKGPNAGGTGRTAASASNSQEIDLYVALPEGVYLYEANSHCLMPVVAGDYRSRSGRRAAARAPMNIFFVVDIAKYKKAPFQEPGLKQDEIQKSYYYVATGLISGNIYLFAASQGLAAHFHNCDKENTHREFKLRPEQRVLYAQTVGYPA
ncbi:MAG TPA: nitroreductase family protein [Sedimentisphaerales bacterium]|nr:nitroreductase family protein [Sedimentisphaerales bacterium]